MDFRKYARSVARKLPGAENLRENRTWEMAAQGGSQFAVNKNLAPAHLAGEFFRPDFNYTEKPRRIVAGVAQVRAAERQIAARAI